MPTFPHKLTSELLRTWWAASKRVTSEQDAAREYGVGLWLEHVTPVQRDEHDEETVVFLFSDAALLVRDDEVRVYTEAMSHAPHTTTP